MRRAARWIAASVLALAPLFVPADARATGATIEVKDFAFQPKSVTIRVGEAVTWVNRDTASHTATAIGSWDTGIFAPGASRSITFTTSGTYPYFCLLHSIMFATITVADDAAAAELAPSEREPQTAANAAAPAATGRIVIAAGEPLAGGLPARAPVESDANPWDPLSWAIFFAGVLVLAFQLGAPRATAPNADGDARIARDRVDRATCDNSLP